MNAKRKSSASKKSKASQAPGEPVYTESTRASYEEACACAEECGCEPRDLVVEEGDRRTLSYGSEGSKDRFMVVRPKSIAEVTHWIGVPDEDLERGGGCGGGADLSRLRSKVISEESLDSEDPAVRDEASGLVRIAAREHVLGNSKRVATWTGVVDTYITKVDPELHIAVLQDIVVEPNATLSLSATTHALYANSIVIYQGGQIVCNGPKTINCKSLEGNKLKLSKGVMVGTLATGVAKASRA